MTVGKAEKYTAYGALRHVFVIDDFVCIKVVYVHVPRRNMYIKLWLFEVATGIVE